MSDAAADAKEILDKIETTFAGLLFAAYQRQLQGEELPPLSHLARRAHGRAHAIVVREINSLPDDREEFTIQEVSVLIGRALAKDFLNETGGE